MANDAQMPELLQRARYMINNPSAWDSFDQGASDMIKALCSDLCASGQQVRALDVDDLAQIIRAVDGDNTLGAGALAEAILAALTPAPQPEGQECPRCGSAGGFGCYECTPAAATTTAQEAVPERKIVERKFYHSQWKFTDLLAARHGGLVTDQGEAWSYRYSHKDGTGGKYDLLFRREPVAHPPQPSETVAEALRDLLHAVCGETGFAACVRHDSGLAYPWPALDEAEKNARAALRALKGDQK